MREGDSIGPKTSGCLEFAVAVFPFRGDDGGEKAFANARDTDRYGALYRVKKKSATPIGLAYHQRWHLLDRWPVIAYANATAAAGIPAEGEELGLQEELVFFQFRKHNGPVRPQSHLYTITLPVSAKRAIDFHRKGQSTTPKQSSWRKAIGKGR